MDQHLAEYLLPSDMGALIECHQVTLEKKSLSSFEQVSAIPPVHLSTWSFNNVGSRQVVFFYYSGWFPLSALSDPHILKIR